MNCILQFSDYLQQEKTKPESNKLASKANVTFPGDSVDCIKMRFCCVDISECLLHPRKNAPQSHPLSPIIVSLR